MPPSYLANLLRVIFSPIVRIFSLSISSTVISVPVYLSALRASISAGFSSATIFARSATNVLKSAFLATKSVSELTSIRAPTEPSSVTYASTRPSAAILPAFFSAAARPFSLRYSTAFSISPLDSVRAFLQSIIPQPVLSLKSFTSLAVNILNYLRLYVILRIGQKSPSFNKISEKSSFAEILQVIIQRQQLQQLLPLQQQEQHLRPVCLR